MRSNPTFLTENVRASRRPLALVAGVCKACFRVLRYIARRLFLLRLRLSRGADAAASVSHREAIRKTGVVDVLATFRADRGCALLGDAFADVAARSYTFDGVSVLVLNPVRPLLNIGLDMLGINYAGVVNGGRLILVVFFVYFRKDR